MKIILLTIFSILILLIAFYNMHSYLSLNNPIRAEILVVEGWIDYDYMPIVLEEFNRNNYNRIVVIAGDKIIPKEKENFEMMPNAELKAMRLRSLSNYTIKIDLVNSEYVIKNQTFNYIVGFKNWLIRELPNTKSVNLISPSFHARKSYILLRRVLPLSINVGVISTPALSYNPKYWWLSKRGLWIVFKNTISYIDAILFANCQNLKC